MQPTVPCMVAAGVVLGDLRGRVRVSSAPAAGADQIRFRPMGQQFLSKVLGQPRIINVQMTTQPSGGAHVCPARDQAVCAQ